MKTFGIAAFTSILTGLLVFFGMNYINNKTMTLQCAKMGIEKVNTAKDIWNNLKK